MNARVNALGLILCVIVGNALWYLLLRLLGHA